MWRYVGPSDPTYKLAEELAKLEVRAWVMHVLREGTLVNLGNRLTPLHQGVPSTQVRIFGVLLDLLILLVEPLTRLCSNAGLGNLVCLPWVMEDRVAREARASQATLAKRKKDSWKANFWQSQREAKAAERSSLETPTNSDDDSSVSRGGWLSSPLVQAFSSLREAEVARESSNARCAAVVKRPREEHGPEMGGLWDSIKQTSQVSRVPKLPAPIGSVGARRAKVMVDPMWDPRTMSTPHLLFSLLVEGSPPEDIPHHLSIHNVPSVRSVVPLARG
jgi:hypothetical protein